MTSLRQTPILICIFLGIVIAVGVHGQAGQPQPAESPVGRPATIWPQIFKRPVNVPVRDKSPVSRAKIELGKRLFVDKRLSGAGDRNCATCHDPAMGFSDGRVRALGRDGQPLLRNTPTLWNLGWANSFYWDGRISTLEDQARVPIEHPNEMGGRLESAAAILSRDNSAMKLLRAAFPSATQFTPELILESIADYERSLVSPITRFDRWIAGEPTAISKQEFRGFQLFTGRAGCLSCHGGWRFTDDKFHDIGLVTADLGRGALGDEGPASPRFKTPGLRELAHTAPYMHDGSKATLEDVVAHYAGGLVTRPSLASNVVRDLRLDAAERSALVAFLRSLSSE